jgi:DNA polymerase-3 subunit epsilon
VIHNAAFDVGFLNHELRLWRPDAPQVEDLCTVVDTLLMARKQHPGQRNSLDALCRRYNVDNSRRDLHGALLDAEILADVYLGMTGGQVSLALGGDAPSGLPGSAPDAISQKRRFSSERAPLPVIRASEAELSSHAQRLQAINDASGGRCLWLTPPIEKAD